MRRTAVAASALIGISVMLAAMILGPALSPPEFGWIGHTTSEQAAQGSPGAWAMRAGFVAYGAGTALSAVLDWRTRPLMRLALAVFGLGLIGTALWSNAPILTGVPADLHEDWLHSVASGVVGTGFAAACAFRLFAHGGSPQDGLALVGLIVSVLVPLAMGWAPELRGLLQRGMFLLSIIFVAREFLRRPQIGDPDVPPG